jgi:hypothetical protein
MNPDGKSGVWTGALPRTPVMVADVVVVVAVVRLVMPPATVVTVVAGIEPGTEGGLSVIKGMPPEVTMLASSAALRSAIPFSSLAASEALWSSAFMSIAIDPAPWLSSASARSWSSRLARSAWWATSSALFWGRSSRVLSLHLMVPVPALDEMLGAEDSWSANLMRKSSAA